MSANAPDPTSAPALDHDDPPAHDAGQPVFDAPADGALEAEIAAEAGLADDPVPAPITDAAPITAAPESDAPAAAALVDAAPAVAEPEHATASSDDVATAADVETEPEAAVAPVVEAEPGAVIAPVVEAEPEAAVAAETEHDAATAGAPAPPAPDAAAEPVVADADVEGLVLDAPAAPAPAIDAAPATDEADATDAAPEPTGPTFAGLDLRPELVDVLAEQGYTSPTPVQEQSIRPLVEGRDLLGQAATGTGKTAAFALPILQRLPERRRERTPLALVLAPTRELAIQVATATETYGRDLGARVLAVYGGAPVGRQWRDLERGVDVVVATPGRAIDLVKRGALDLSGLEVVVLDEADEMLDMGFVEDIETILESTPRDRQTVLFSATMPRRIASLADRHMNDPVRLRLGEATVAAGDRPRIRQTAYLVARKHATAALARVLELEQPTAALVFCRTRADVDAVTEALGGGGLKAESLHGGLDQEQRARVLDRLRSGVTDLVVATDVAARGLDVDHLTHVVNHDVPQSPEAYVHRIGRVGRAGREGVAITLAPPKARRALERMERLAGQQEIEVKPVPTLTDLAGARTERMRTTLRERLIADGAVPKPAAAETEAALEGAAATVPAHAPAPPKPIPTHEKAAAKAAATDPARAVVLQLAEEFDAVDVALAAMRIAQEAAVVAGGAGDAIPELDSPRARRDDRDGGRGRDRHEGGGRGRDRHDDRGRGRPARDDRDHGGRSHGGGATTRLFVNAGREAGIGPKDIVGAFANESQLSGRDIGAIKIFDRHALVEVPEAAADSVVRDLRGATLRGRKANVRRDREPEHGGQTRDDRW